MPCAEVKRPYLGRLPQNRREDKGNRADIEMRTNPANLDDFRLTHQCTNWELVRTG
jgi:hypothetical protein